MGTKLDRNDVGGMDGSIKSNYHSPGVNMRSFTRVLISAR